MLFFLTHSPLKKRDPDGDSMKKSANKPLLDTVETREEHDVVVVKLKTENEFELDGDASEDSSEVYTNGLHIQIKEEPYSQKISQEPDDWDTSSCLDTKPHTVTFRSDDVQHQELRIKDECDSDHQSEYDLSETSVKEEEELWIKEDRDSEEDGENPHNLHGVNEEAEEVCTGKGDSFLKNNSL